MTYGTSEEEVKTESNGFLAEKYKNWSIQFPDKAAEYGILGGPQPLHYLSTFLEESPGIFDDIFDSKNDTVEKNVETSTEFRNQGNREYQKKFNLAALQSYTQALLFAPDGSEAMALAYANRSAVLASMGENSAALRDISRALSHDYPKHLRHKLDERKAKCLVGLKLYDEALKAFAEAEQSIEFSTLASDKKEQLLAEWQTQKSSAEKLANANPGSNKSSKIIGELFFKERPRYKSKLPKLTSPNQKFPALSSSVEIVRNDSVGRYAVATRDIRAGELISVEDPVVSRLNGNRNGRNCCHCFDIALDFLPSPITNQDVFCSEACLAEAMATYHPIESSFIHLINKSESVRTEWILALRAITQKPLQFFLEHAQDFAVHQPTYGTDEKTPPDFVYDSSNFKSIFNLVTLHDQWRSADHQFRAFVAFFFLQCLQKANYFRSSSSTGNDVITSNGNGEHTNGVRKLTNDEELICSILIHLMAVASLNCYAVGLFEAAPDAPWHTGSPLTLGSTYQPTLALLNHSCDPNVIRYNVARGTILVANRDILKGQEVSDCYYSTYAELDVAERKLKLSSKYHFECQCRPCRERWPLHSDLPKGFNDGKILVTLEDLPKEMAAIQKLGSAISLEQKAENYEKLITLYLEFVRLLQSTIDPPHAFYFMACRHLYKCFWIINGSRIRAMHVVT